VNDTTHSAVSLRHPIFLLMRGSVP